MSSLVWSRRSARTRIALRTAFVGNAKIVSPSASRIVSSLVWRSPEGFSARIDSAFENRPVSLISRLLLTASSMRADRRAEGACHRLPSAWLTLILAGLVVLSVPFATASLQRATAPPPVPSSPHRALTMNAAFLRGVTGSFTENRGQLRDGDVRYTFAAGGLRVGMVTSGLLIVILADRAGTSAASSRPPSDSPRDA